MDQVNFFSADYRDGRVRIGSKTYPAGYYCVHLLNQYYKDDTVARLSVFTHRNEQLQIIVSKLVSWDMILNPSSPVTC